MMQQLVEAVKGDNVNFKNLEERLNVSFTESNQKHFEGEKTADINKQRVELVMHTVSAMSTTVS